MHGAQKCLHELCGLCGAVNADVSDRNCSTDAAASASRRDDDDRRGRVRRGDDPPVRTRHGCRDFVPALVALRKSNMTTYEAPAVVEEAILTQVTGAPAPSDVA